MPSTAIWGAADGHYNDWSAFLDRWASGEPADPAALPALVPEDLPTDAWQRLATRFVDALDRKLGTWAKALTNAIAESRDEFAMARALTQARTGLTAARALAAHPGLPKELSDQLTGLVDRQIASAQRSLEDGVERMRRSGVPHEHVEARLRTIRDNSFTTPAAKPDPGAVADGWAAGGTATTRRRVIVD